MGAVWGLGEARTEPRQVPADAEIGQKTAQVPLGETVQGDPGDPPGHSETPSGQPPQPLGGAGCMVGLAAGWHLARAAGARSLLKEYIFFFLRQGVPNIGG